MLNINLGAQDLRQSEPNKITKKLALDHGVIVEKYLTDNGVFKTKAFTGHLREHDKKIQYYGVNAHYRNPVA